MSAFTNKNISESIENFKQDEELEKKLEKKKKEMEKEGIYSKEENFPDEVALKTAIECARSDLMVRTLGKPDKEGIAKEEFGAFRDMLKTYFSDEVKNKEAFDSWHIEACKCVLEIINGYYHNAKYGKAQKLVNMTFKYLYCLKSNGDIDEKYFEFCHMPIDSIMLEWIKREEKKEPRESFNANKVPSWSNLESPDKIGGSDNSGKKYGYYTYEESGHYTYDKFVDLVGKLIENYKNDDNQLTPLLAEFVIWPRMRTKLATEEFLQQIDQKTKSSRKEKEAVKEESLEENLKRIQENLNSMNL